jgi:hypothetical protein
VKTPETAVPHGGMPVRLTGLFRSNGNSHGLWQFGMFPLCTVIAGSIF